MVSRHERMRLMQEFRDEPSVGVAVVLRCAAALTVVVVLAITGVMGDTTDQSVAIANFHRWQLADREAAQPATHAQAVRSGDVNARQSTIRRPASTLAEPVRN